MYTYTVSVFTGKVHDAKTNARVYMSLYGSGDRILVNGLEIKGQFSIGSACSQKFTSTECFDSISKIRVWHDNTGSGPGWFLDYVVIRCDNTGAEWFFYAYRWLDKKSGDGKTDIFIPGNKHCYLIWIKTGNRKNAGTDANVYVQLCGSRGISQEFLIGTAKSCFETNKEDGFHIVCDYDWGILDSINIRHDNTGNGPGWFIESIRIKYVNGDISYYFAVNRWLAKDADDRQISRNIKVTSKSLITDSVRYPDKRALMIVYDKNNKGFSYTGVPQFVVKNESQCMVDMFNKNGVPLLYLAGGYSRREYEEKIKGWFANTTSNSMSFIYLICHGGKYGVDIIKNPKVPNDVYMSYEELKELLDKYVKGEKVLLIESCASGSSIEYNPDNGYGPLCDQKYHIFCSTTPGDNSNVKYHVSEIWATGCRNLHPLTVRRLQDYTVKVMEMSIIYNHWLPSQRPQMWSYNTNVVLFD